MEIDPGQEGDEAVRRSSIEKQPVIASLAESLPQSVAFVRLPEEIIEQ
jgi:hypothetical protein